MSQPIEQSILMEIESTKKMLEVLEVNTIDLYTISHSIVLQYLSKVNKV